MAINPVKMTTPGERLKYVREGLLKMSRAQIHDAYGLSPDTLAAWENGKNQLTEKGIDRCIKIYSDQNVIISKEWILTGHGLSPKFSFDLNRYFKNITTEGNAEKLDDQILIAKEIEYFLSLSNNSTTCLISNEDMLPMYSVGDYVGGRFRFKDDLNDCVGKDCIIKTVDNAMFVRRVSKSQQKDRYNLACLNPAWSGNPEPVIFDVAVECAAPIVWHRRHDD